MAWRNSTLDPHPLFSGNIPQYMADKREGSMDTVTVTAEDVLARFKPEIDWVTRTVTDAFDLDHSKRDDVHQEAMILVSTYAGLMPGWHFDKLRSWEISTNGDHDQVKKLLAKTLREDLSQTVARQLEKEQQLDVISIESLVPGTEPTYSFENAVIDQIDSDRDIRVRYPLLSRNVLDGYTQEEIAAMDGIPLRTVERKFAAERKAFKAEHSE